MPSSFTADLPYPFRTAATALSEDVASLLWDVAVGGRAFKIDRKSNRFNVRTLDYMRQQQDTGEEAGEQSLSTIDLWRKSYRSWHLGAGQTRGDSADSSPYRFLSSKGLDCWTDYRLSLLPNTTQVDSQSGALPSMEVVGSTLMAVYGTAVRKSTDGTTWSTAATLASAPTTGLASDGAKAFVGCADSKVKSVTTGGTVTDEWTLSTSPSVIGMAKGRLWAGAGVNLYALLPGVAAAVQFAHPWAGWTWTAIAEGSRAVYAAGYLGDKSQIYRVGIKADGSGLDSAYVAATLPDGETVSSMGSYLGFVLLGTSKGLRLAITDGNGDLTYGSLIPTTGAVGCFEPQDRFVWFGWTNYDGVSTGLGRLDLSNFITDLTPAYASDLMATGQGSVTSVTTFGGKRYFTVNGLGTYKEGTGQVASGTLTTSSITFGINDDKIASLIDMTHEALDGTIDVYLAVDGSSPGLVSESAVQGSSGPPSTAINPITGHRFSLTVTLVDGAGSGPALTSLTLYGHPIPARTVEYTLPLLVGERLDMNSTFHSFDSFDEYVFLRTLVEDGAAVTLQIAGGAYTVFPVDFQWFPYSQTEDSSAWNGTFVLIAREVSR